MHSAQCTCTPDMSPSEISEGCSQLLGQIGLGRVDMQIIGLVFTFFPDVFTICLMFIKARMLFYSFIAGQWENNVLYNVLQIYSIGIGYEMTSL